MKSLHPKIFQVFFVLALAAVAWKVFFVVFGSSAMGYGNNWDFIRQSSCTGIWIQYEGKEKFDGNHESFVKSFVNDGERRKDLCLRSTGNSFVHLAALTTRLGSPLDIRYVSAIKILAIFAMAIFLLKRNLLPTRWLLSIAFLLVFSDFYNLLYVNTLYLEFQVLMFAFFSVGVLLSINGYERFSGPRWWLLFMASIVALGLAKQQYMPLACFLAVLGAAVYHFQYRKWKFAASLIGLALLLPFIYTEYSNISAKNNSGISYANKTNTFMWTVLPEAQDKKQALEILNLPEQCEQAIGFNWYATEISIRDVCPEIAHVSRAKLLPLFATDPGTFWRPFVKGMRELYPFHPENLGYQEKGTVVDAATLALAQQTSTSYALKRFHDWNPHSSLWGFIAVFAAAPLLLLAALRCSRPAVSNALLCAGIGGVMACYSILSSIFGDGYVEVEKHSVAFSTGMAFFFTGILVLLPVALGQNRK